MAFFRRDDSDSAALILWASVVITMLRLSLEASALLVLGQVYGWQRVAREHLSIVRVKPELVVSNGDVLRGLGVLHYSYGVGIWLSSSVLVLVVTAKHFAPRWWAKASVEKRRMRPRAFGVVVALALFAVIGGSPSFGSAIAVGTIAAAASTWWLRNSVSRDDVLGRS